MPDDDAARPSVVVEFGNWRPTRRDTPAVRSFKRRPFDLNDFLGQLQKIRETGPVEELIGMIRGLSLETKNEYINVQERQWRHVEAIVGSMTPWERSHPDHLDGSRLRRIVRGSGTSPALANKVLKQFNEMRRMMSGPRGSGPSVA